MTQFFSMLSKVNSLDYLTKNSKIRLETLFNLESKFRTAYFLEDEKYFPYILLNESFSNIRDNYASGGSFKIEDIEVDAPVIYKGEQYFFRGIGEDGFVSIEEVPAKRQSKKNSPLIIKIKKEMANEKITPVLEVKRGGSHHNLSVYLSELLGMKKNKFSVSKSILIVTNMREISKVKDLKISLEKGSFNFTTLCPSILLTNNNESYRYLGVKSKRIKNFDIPANIFTTQLVDANYFLEAHLSKSPNKFKTTIEKIVIIGNQYMHPNQSSYLYDLIDLAEEGEIPVSFYGTTDIVYGGLKADITKEFEIFAWTPKYINQSERIKFDLVNTNELFYNNLKEIDEYIVRLEEEGLFHLKIRTMELRNLVLQQIYQDKQTSELLESHLADLQLFYSFDDAISENFHALFENRYVHNVARQIRKHLEKDNELILVVPTYYKGAADRLIKDCGFKNKILASEEAPMFNTNRNKFLLSYLPKKDLVKWFTRFRGIELTVLCPKGDLQSFNRFIHYLNYSITKIEDINSLNTSYPNNQSWIISPLGEETFDEIISDKLEKPTTESSTSFSDILKEAENNIDYKENSKGKPVKIDRVFKMESARFLAATPSLKLFYFDEENYIKQDKASKFEIGDYILLLDIPYSNELYYETLKRGSSHQFVPSLSTQTTSIQDLDLEWKNQLKNYYDNQRLTPTILANHFSNLGFVKSIGFFQSWINPNSVNLLPKDPSFIKYIGILTKNDKLINHYMEYYNASKRLKEEFKSIRQKMIKSLLNNKYDEQTLRDMNISATIQKIGDIEVKEDFYIDEYLSNKLI